MPSLRRWLRVDEVVLFQRDEDIVARMVADHAGHMTAPACIFGEHHVARSEAAHAAVAVR